MSATPLILSLETATLGGSVFLARGSVQLAARIGNPQVSQSSSLLQDINDSLAQADVSLEHVDLFACASGPGSFTGLRIGIATLKALAASLKRPCVGIPTLQAVAHAAGYSSGTVAVLPAGRGEVFAQMFSVSDNEGVTEMDSPVHLSPQKLVERYASFTRLKWAGSGAHLQRELLESYAEKHGITFVAGEYEPTNVGNKPPVNTWELAQREVNLAKHVAALALHAYETGKVISPHFLSAIYVRPSDAELNEKRS